MSEAQNQDTVISVGEQLKHLREQNNFSVQDIATRLHLEARIIEAIEDDKFEILPAATYVRGYLRSYAKILKADADAMILSYNNAAPAPPEIVPEVKHVAQSSSSDKPVKAFTYLISLTLVILLVAWWQSNYIVDGNSVSGDATGTASQSSYGLSYKYPIIEHPASPFYHVSVPPEEKTPPTDETESINPANAQAAAETDNRGQYPAFVTTDNQGPDVLVLRLEKDSWIEVFDSQKHRVYVNLAHAGQVLSLQGTAPFSIVLGFAEGVTVQFNGEPFDTKPYTHGSIARFSLGN